MASQMVLRCTKTGRLFFSQAEATEHAEAFGAAYANFDEVAMDAKCWVCEETARYALDEAKMNDMKRRDPESKTWEPKTVAYLLEVQKKKDQASKRKNQFLDSVDQKKLLLLTEVKGHGKNRAAKALHFTKEQKTVEAAEKWLTEHVNDTDLDKLEDAFLDEQLGAVDVDMGDGDVVMEEPDTRQIGDPNPPEVKEVVNQDSLKQLMEMGFSELRAEKALYTRDNNLEHAVAWLSEHLEDADIDLPVKPKPKAAPPKAPISEEEKARKVAELEERIRQKKREKAEEEKISEKEKERQRVESTRMMILANERLKEEERKRAIEQQRLEKEAHEKHKAQLKEQLRLDYIDRFGCEPPEEEDEKEKGIKDKPLREQLLHWLNKMKKTYKDSNPEGLKTCMNTLKIYGDNLKNNPQEPKFKTLKKENKAFQARIAPFPEAMEILDCIGFEDKGDALVQRKSIPDDFLIGELIKFSDIILRQI